MFAFGEILTEPKTWGLRAFKFRMFGFGGRVCEVALSSSRTLAVAVESSPW